MREDSPWEIGQKWCSLQTWNFYGRQPPAPSTSKKSSVLYFVPHFFLSVVFLLLLALLALCSLSILAFLNCFVLCVCDVVVRAQNTLQVLCLVVVVVVVVAENFLSLWHGAPVSS